METKMGGVARSNEGSKGFKMVARGGLVVRALLAASAVALAGGPASALPAAGPADKVQLTAALGTPVLLAGSPQKAFLKVGLTGFALPGTERVPVNVALVLDRSGSMEGDKLARAKDAAIAVLELLDARDAVSVVAYDDTVTVLVPAAPLKDKAAAVRAIQGLRSGNSTALFAGVSKGADELRKLKASYGVSRVLLLSDGQANVGPQAPGELGDLGAALQKDGISVTTIGLGTGYNEDLMAQLARRSDGNHAFVEKADDLARVFRLEFGDLLSVVAQEVLLKVRCAPGVKALRVLGRDAEVREGQVTALLSQLYSRQEKYLVVELEVPERAADSTMEVASVDVSYGNMVSKATDVLHATVAATFAREAAQVETKTDAQVMVSATKLVAMENNKQAVALRDQGKTQEAQQVLQQNAAFLKKEAERFKSGDLGTLGASQAEDAKNIADQEGWNVQRKAMRRSQNVVDMQQSY